MTAVQKYNSNATAYPLPDTKAIARVIIITKTITMTINNTVLVSQKLNNVPVKKRILFSAKLSRYMKHSLTLTENSNCTITHFFDNKLLTVSFILRVICLCL